MFFSQIRHRNALTEISWEDAVQGIGMVMAMSIVVSLLFRGHDLLKITNINRQQGARFLLWKKLDYSRGRRKWSLGLGQHLKGAWPNVRTELKVAGK